MGDECSTNRDKKNERGLVLGEPEGKKPLGRPRCTWVDNIKADLAELGWVHVYWIAVPQDRYKWRALVNAVMTFRVL
jgi:hypothetical protein